MQAMQIHRDDANHANPGHKCDRSGRTAEPCMPRSTDLPMFGLAVLVILVGLCRPNDSVQIVEVQHGRA